MSNPAPKLRKDIEGLRAIAILTVVLFHATVPGFSGGYIGVDLFFVLSGYLISGLLLDERARTGTIGFASFYARRARRLLPASAAMMLAVTIAGMFISPPSVQGWFAAGVSFASLYMSNIQFIRSGADYYDGSAERHPLLHTWSLSVEEQFYFVWPLAIAGVAYLVSQRHRLRATHLLAAITLAGFAAAEWSRHELPLEGFYFSAFRLWEFSAGALLAAYQRDFGPISGPIERAGGWIGLLLLLGSSSLMTSDSTFPGVGALPTVLGTLLVLHGTTGAAETPLHRLLGLAPLQTLGRLSYSLYLWHWPFLVFGAALLPYATVWHRLGLVVASAVAAELSFRFVESPLRHHRWLAVSPRRSIVVAILVTFAMAVVGVGWKVSANRWAKETAATSEVWDASLKAWPVRTQSAEANSAVPVMLGAPDGRERWVLLGDSHAEVWYPALSTLLAARDIRLELFTKIACPAMLQKKTFVRQDYPACDAWRLDALAQIERLRPSVLLLSSREEQPFPDEAWAGATEALLGSLHPLPAKV
ncbi:MAG: acyltransferase, partial [Deltaproteobacteria bacterium]|nr:acyltransferase [Deltaproteobacteria bacterium]